MLRHTWVGPVSKERTKHLFLALSVEQHKYYVLLYTLFFSILGQNVKDVGDDFFFLIVEEYFKLVLHKINYL